MEITQTPVAAERPAARGAVLDSSTFLPGTWLSTNSSSPGLVSLSLGAAEGGLSIGLSWAGDGAPVTWRPVITESLYAESLESRKAIALSGTCDFGAVRCRVQANMTLGLIVLAAFNRFAPGTGLVDFFSRGFFYPLDGSEAEASPRADTVDMTGLAPAVMQKTIVPVDPAPFAGTWINTNRASKGVVKYVIATAGPQVVARAVTAAGRDLGEAPVHVYAKDGEPPEPMAFLATFDAGDREIEIQARLNLGLLVVVYFHRPKDGSGSNWYTREFYHKA